MWKSRSLEQEIIDLGPQHYSLEEYRECLFHLDRVGKWLGGDRATFSALSRMDQSPSSILDVGCGGGLNTLKLALRYPKAKVVGIDLNTMAIDFANQRLASIPNPPRNLTFECRLQEKLEESEKSYDVVISTLVCHHMPDQDLIDFISRARQIAKKRVILNDLHRHPLAFYLFKLISPIFFNNRLVRHDGPLSIRRAFTHQEWMHYLKTTGITPSQYQIKWQWAFRWLIEINCGSEK